MKNHEILYRFHVSCDGSYRPVDGDFRVCTGGVVIDSYEGKKHEFSYCHGHGTSNIAELTAILDGLQTVCILSTLTPEQLKKAKVVIESDSQYAIGVLSRNMKAVKNLTLIRKVQKKMEEFGEVVFEKVKGHQGNVGNERADKLAKKASKKPFELLFEGNEVAILRDPYSFVQGAVGTLEFWKVTGKHQVLTIGKTYKISIVLTEV